MDRRNFLQGIFGGIVGSGIIVQASASEINLFANKNPEGTPLGLAPNGYIDNWYLYNSKGEVVVYINAIKNHDETLEASRKGKSFKELGPGVLRRPTLIGEVIAPGYELTDTEIVESLKRKNNR